MVDRAVKWLRAEYIKVQDIAVNAEIDDDIEGKQQCCNHQNLGIL